ncbi:MULTISPECIES: hypothetical protein [Shewanella]|uniref:hypothetical protein n=1 Tax=Shewanella TaxID=22 RepID=UPI0016035DF5|nr:hypothetical protein [Shewanella sp. SG44-2]MBB1427468.1 hypothetical protein [Shewanella sp. SG44-2]|tara:strand:+ start:399 stop:662 length:264 start_codon:yes stop_codon:yes gene_type:complete
MTLKPIYIGVLSFMLLASFAANANPHDRKPPKEAVEACANSAENDQVSFDTPRGDTLEATCQIIDGELVAVPANGPDDMKQPPKQRN